MSAQPLGGLKRRAVDLAVRTTRYGRGNDVSSDRMAAAMTTSASFLSVRNYIEARYGAGSFRRVRDVLHERGFTEFPHVLTPGAKYPTPMLTAMIDAACELFGSDDFYERCGRAIVEYEINVLLRFALQLTTPLGVVERAGDPWRKVHSAGNWTIDGDKYHVVAQLDGFPTTAGYCRLLTAYFHRLFELTGARNVVLEHPTCVARGNGACRFEGRWNP